eukprot:gene2073-2471_t
MRKEKTPLHKINAHIETGLSVAWHPHLPNTLATGSRDKTVKIWSLSNPQATVFHPSATLHTSSSVSQVSWRPIDGATDKKLQLATSSTNSPDVCLWTLGSPNYPACVLGGLSNPCAGFAWLDTPSAQVEEGGGRGLWQHLVCAGKREQVLIQDLRHALYPKQHMCGLVAALSPNGTLAELHNDIEPGDPLGLSLEPGGDDSFWYSLTVPPLFLKMKQPSPTTPTTLPIGTHSSTMPVHGQTSSGYDSEGPSESTEPSGPPSLPLEDVPVAKRVTGEVCLYMGDTSAGWTVGPQDPETVRRLALVYHVTVEGEGVGNTCNRLGQAAERLGYPQYRTLWRGVSVLLPGLQEELSRPGNGPDTEYICCSFLRTTLLRLLDLGDVQHVVCVSETLRHAGLLSARVTDPLSSLPPSRLSEAYQSYWDLLHRLRLSQLACVLSSSCPVTCLAEASRKGVELKHSCSRCGREVVDVGAGSRLADVATGDTGPASTGGFLQRSALDQRREGDMQRPVRITQYANRMSSPSVLLDADIAAQCP